MTRPPNPPATPAVMPAVTPAEPPVVSPVRARTARVAVSLVFFANGAIAATVVPRFPAITEALSLSNTELGTAVSAMALGGLLAGGLVGVLVGRFGSRLVSPLAGTAAALMLVAVGLAPSWAMLALAYLVLGMFDATMDASMNAHGYGVQRVYRRSILQGFHGMWALGSMVAAAIGAAAAAMGVPVAIHLGVAAGVLAITALVSGHWFLPSAVADAHDEAAAPLEPVHLRILPRLLRILVPIALLGILCATLQNAAATWSPRFLVDILGQPEGIAAMGFVLYMAGMVVGRMTNDQWIDRWGSTAVVRAGALVGVAAMVAIMASAPLGLPLLAFLGFALIGVGSSSMFPVMVGAAASRPGIPAAHGVAMVTWLVRFGLIAAPALIGAAADTWGLPAALGVSLAASVAIVVLAPVLTAARRFRATARPLAA